MNAPRALTAPPRTSNLATAAEVVATWGRTHALRSATRACCRRLLHVGGSEIGPDTPTSSASSSGAGGSGGDASTSSASGTGAGGGTVEAQGWVSGGRLRARLYVGADGSKQFIGFYDSQRQENCYPRAAGDGKTRCMPEALAAAYFADAGCIQQVGITAKGCAPPEYGSTGETSSCGTPVATIHALGPKSNPAQVYNQAGGAGCLPFDASPYDVYAVGASVPHADFVEVTEEVE